MTTQIDVLNAQIADAQVRLAAETSGNTTAVAKLNASSALKLARIGKEITDFQNQITTIQNAQLPEEPPTEG